jgi:GT2 family glycosyltransferase
VSAPAAGGDAGALPGPIPGPISGPIPDPTAEPTPAVTPDISVIIPHLNDTDRLRVCLAALAAQRLAPGQSFEVLVVDNGSREPPEALVSAFPGMRLVLEPVPGPGPARNRGIALAAAPVVAFLDSDCIPDPGWLAAMLAGFAADPTCEVQGGAVEIFAADPARPNLAEAFDLVYGIRQELTIRRHGFAATANLAVRREVFSAVGGFEGLHISEDMEWGMRAKAKGYPTRFNPEAVMRHPARDEMADLRRQWDRHVSHHWSMQPKTARGRAEWVARAAAMALSPVAEVPRVLRSARLKGARQRLSALDAVTRMRLYRARRMLAEFVDPASRQKSAHWNRS